MSEGLKKVSEYLVGRLSLFELNNWSLEFGDDQVSPVDQESMDLAGLITELVHNLGTGLIDEESFSSRLANQIRPSISQRRQSA